MKDDFPTPAAYGHAAWFLMCEVAALQAIAQVEAGPLGAFNDDGTPVILFERHKFDKLTHGLFRGTALEGNADSAWSSISEPTSGGYGPPSAQHRKLDLAALRDRNAALQSCSWGLFQILGENWQSAGFDSLQAFVNAMIRDVDGHLRALVMFIRNDRRLLTALRSRDWAAFAFAYNGPQFKKNSYDAKMAAAYKKLTS